MVHSSYQYVLDLFASVGTSLGRVAPRVDWEPAREWARFSAIRQAKLPGTEPVLGSLASIEPLWHPATGEPYVKGFRVSLSMNGQGAFAHDFSTAYFKALALQASACFVEKGKLAAGETFQFLVSAFACQEDSSQTIRRSFIAEEVVPGLPLREASLSEHLSHSDVMGVMEPGDMPVVIPRRVLRDAASLTREAGAKETGGIVLGHLHRDSSLPEVFAEVTAQLPARHVESTVASLTFTKDTWTDVRAALDLRQANELMLGWWHSHPVYELCKDCPLERRKVCKLSHDFYSAHDHALHRAVFPRAYSIGLVVNDVGYSDPTFSLFGWNRGVLESRGFHVREDEYAQWRITQ